MAGRRATNCSRRLLKNGSPPTTSAWPAAARASRRRCRFPSPYWHSKHRVAYSVCARLAEHLPAESLLPHCSGFTSRAMIVVFGRSSSSRPSRFGPKSILNQLTPVMFPPGRLKLSTRPALTGSPPKVKTIGMVAVAALAASTDRTPPAATITVTRRSTRSAASPGTRSFRPSAQRKAMSRILRRSERSPLRPSRARARPRGVRTSLVTRCGGNRSPALPAAARAPRAATPLRRRERDELSPLHSITSSARASSVGGISTPNAFAVARLMTSSNLVPSSTGRSPGFSPLRIRPT